MSRVSQSRRSGWPRKQGLGCRRREATGQLHSGRYGWLPGYAVALVVEAVVSVKMYVSNSAKQGWEDKGASLSLVGGAVASSLVRSTPEQALRVRALAGDIVLCS